MGGAGTVIVVFGVLIGLVDPSHSLIMGVDIHPCTSSADCLACQVIELPNELDATAVTNASINVCSAVTAKGAESRLRMTSNEYTRHAARLYQTPTLFHHM